MKLLKRLYDNSITIGILSGVVTVAMFLLIFFGITIDSPFVVAVGITMIVAVGRWSYQNTAIMKTEYDKIDRYLATHPEKKEDVISLFGDKRWIRESDYQRELTKLVNPDQMSSGEALCRKLKGEDQ